MALNTLKNIYKYFKRGGYRSDGLDEISVKKQVGIEMLKDKNIIVTGGSSGIGLAIAKRCNELGANVLITGRNRDKLELSRVAIGERTKIYINDIQKLDDSDCKNLFSIFGRVDALVNNAGICPVYSAFPVCSVKMYNDTVETNLNGAFHILQAYIKYCIENNVKGTIVNTASNSSLVGLTSPYAISKYGITSLTEGLSKEFCKYGIRINSVAPDVTISNITEWSKSVSPEDNLFDMNVRRNRIFRADEIAEVVVFLLSDRSKLINGQTIACDNSGSLAENTVG